MRPKSRFGPGQAARHRSREVARFASEVDEGFLVSSKDYPRSPDPAWWRPNNASGGGCSLLPSLDPPGTKLPWALLSLPSSPSGVNRSPRPLANLSAAAGVCSKIANAGSGPPDPRLATAPTPVELRLAAGAAGRPPAAIAPVNRAKSAAGCRANATGNAGLPPLTTPARASAQRSIRRIFSVVLASVLVVMRCSSLRHAVRGNASAAGRAAMPYDESANASCAAWNAAVAAPGHALGAIATPRLVRCNVVTYFAAWFCSLSCPNPQRQRKERVGWSVHSPVSFL